MVHCKLIETRISTIEFDAEGFLVVRQKDDLVANREDFENSINIYQTFFHGNKFPNLLILGKNNEYSEEAIQYNAPLVQNKLFSAQAIVLKILAHRLAINFYNRMHPAAYPQKIFDNEEEARIWLRQFR